MPLQDHELVALANLKRDLDFLHEENVRVFEHLVLPNWGKHLHGMKHILYGGMMMCFAYIDLLSTYWNGGAKGFPQNPRMTGFMTRYLHCDREAAVVATKIWRHKLMHTARPRPLVREGTGMRYDWLLQWGEPHLKREEHFAFNDTSDRRILATGLNFLIEDLQRAFLEYRSELFTDEALLEKFRSGRHEVKWELVKPI